MNSESVRLKDEEKESKAVNTTTKQPLSSEVESEPRDFEIRKNVDSPKVDQSLESGRMPENLQVHNVEEHELVPMESNCSFKPSTGSI